MKHDEYAIMYGVEETHWWYRALRAMIQEFLQEIPPGARVLDAGCGTGANMAALDIPCGIDYSIEAVRFCRQRGLTATAAASATALPFNDDAFDAAISCDVLCHRSIANKTDMLNECARVLRPGGLLLLNLPAYQWLLSSHDHYVGTDKRFRRKEMADLLATANLAPVRMTYWNTFLFPAAALVRLWRKLRPPPTSDLAAGSGSNMNGVFNAILRAERALTRIAPLPFGLSLMVLARKKERAI